MKLRCIEDLDYILDNLSESDKHLLVSFSGSFIHFIEDYLLSDLYSDLKIILTAVKAIRLVI